MASTLQETVREDGLRVITKKLPFVKSVVLAVSALAGLADDHPDKEGLLHFFEHMAFKGTTTKSRQDIKKLLGRFVNSNAYTDWLRTCYYASAPYFRLQLLQDIIFDIYSNPIFPEDEIEKEKEVVLNEIARDWDNDNYRAYFALWENLWEKNPMRIFGVGTPEGVKNINRNDLIAGRNHWHVPSNTLAIAVGNIDHEDFVAEINRHAPLFDSMVSHMDWSDEYENLPQKSEIIIERPKREKAVIVYGCKFPLYVDERISQTSQFLQYLLTKGHASVLWNEIREKRGLAYTVSGGVSGEHPLGKYFYVAVETLPKRIEEVRELIYKFVHSPLENGADMETIREYLFDWFSLGYDDPGDWADLIRGRIKLNVSPKTAEKHFEKRKKIISKLTLDEVEAMRQEVLKPERFVTVVVKPV